MKARVATVPISITVLALALACNAYATPGGVVSQASLKNSVSGRWNKMRRAAHASGVYDLNQSYRLEQAIPDKSSRLSTSGDVSASQVGRATIPRKVISCAAVAMIGMSIMSHPFGLDSMASLLTSYNSLMGSFPLETKVATGVALAVLGDALAQIRERSQSSYNPGRALSFAAFDSCYRVFQHNAFPVIISTCQGSVAAGLLSLLPGVVVGSNLKIGLAALERTLVYQFVLIPLLYYPIFFTFTGYLQGLDPKQILERAKTNFFPCWRRNLMFWIPIQMVMFGLIDEKWQIPFACVMGILWSMILSATAGNAKTA